MPTPSWAAILSVLPQRESQLCICPEDVLSAALSVSLTCNGPHALDFKSHYIFLVIQKICFWVPDDAFVQQCLLMSVGSADQTHHMPTCATSRTYYKIHPIHRPLPKIPLNLAQQSQFGPEFTLKIVKKGFVIHVFSCDVCWESCSQVSQGSVTKPHRDHLVPLLLNNQAN